MLRFVPFTRRCWPWRHKWGVLDGHRWCCRCAAEKPLKSDPYPSEGERG